MPEMKNIVGVRFRRAGRVYYFDPAGIELGVKDCVVVETEHGLSIGRVVIAPKQVIASELTEPLKPVLRKASQEDLQRWEEATRKEQEALSKCKELISKFELPMKLLDAQSNLDATRLTIFFSAEKRVDFRQMVRELAASLKMRIELRQVGVRDETKLVGGVGPCGRELCCTTFLTEFAPLSIKMVKEQNLSLAPDKVSGLCGRLLCCLGYESEFYRSMREKMPHPGQKVATPLGTAEVVEVNPLKETVTVQLESQAKVELPLSEIKLIRRAAKESREQA